MLKKTCFISLFFLFFVGCSSNQTAIKSNNFIKPAKKEIIISYEEYKKIFEEKAQKEQKKIVFNPIITPKEYKKLLSEGNDNLTYEDTFSSDAEVKQALMEFYDEWKDVKYKFGGNSKKGIDCSAFIQKAFRDKFNVRIPRTTISQVTEGQKINKSELQIGDLVFFKSRKHGRHVGIYMGNGKFMHASIKGIKFSKLSKNYYKKNYWTSRRVLN